MPLNKVKTIFTLFLTVIVLYCKGQVDNNGAKSVPLQTQIGTQNPFLLLKPKEQISQVVRMMLQDSKGNIWFGAENGAWRLTNNILFYIDSIKSESGTRVTIHDITEGKDGKIWLAHTDGVSSIDGEKVKNYYVSDGLIHYDAWCIAADLNGNVWIGTQGGVCVFNGHKFTNFDLPEGERDTTVGVSSSHMVHNIMVDSKGAIWFCSTAGLFSYIDKKLMNVSDKVGIKTNFINEIVEDEGNAYWVSTKDGLYRLADGRAINITKGKIETGKGIGSIAKDENGKLWFVSNQHYLFNYENKILTEFIKSEDNKGPVIFQIYKDQQNRLWFVGTGGAYRLENEKFVNITKDGPW